MRQVVSVLDAVDAHAQAGLGNVGGDALVVDVVTEAQRGVLAGQEAHGEDEGHGQGDEGEHEGDAALSGSRNKRPINLAAGHKG